MADALDHTDIWERHKPSAANIATEHQHVLTIPSSYYEEAHLEAPLYTVVSEFQSWLDDKDERASAFKAQPQSPAPRKSKSGAFIDQLISHAGGGSNNNNNNRKQQQELEGYKSTKGSQDRDRPSLTSSSQRGQLGASVPTFRPSMPGFGSTAFGNTSGSLLDSVSTPVYSRTASSDCGLVASAKPSRGVGVRSNLAAAMAACGSRLISSGRQIQRGRVSSEGRQAREALSGENTELPATDGPALPALRTSGNGVPATQSSPLSKMGLGQASDERPSLGGRWRGRSVEVPDSILLGTNNSSYERHNSSEMVAAGAVSLQDERPSVGRRWRGRSVELPGTGRGLDKGSSQDRLGSSAGQLSPRPPVGARSPSMPVMQAPPDSMFVHGGQSLWDPEIDALIVRVGLDEEPASDRHTAYRRAKTQQPSTSLSSSKSRLGQAPSTGDGQHSAAFLPQVRSKASTGNPSPRGPLASGSMELGMTPGFLMDSWS